MLDPVLGESAAIADCGPERALVIADYHAGLEVSLRRDGVEIQSHAASRRETVRRLLAEHDIDRVLFLGDVGTAIGESTGIERNELETLFDAVTARVPVTITKGNHDGAIEAVTESYDDVEVVDGYGTRIGTIGFCHGHTWPAKSVVEAPILCTSHEHPQVRLEDEVGGSRTERIWLRGEIDPSGFPEYDSVGDQIVVFPAFNDLSGGTYVNETEEFLSPFLPAGLACGEAYLLDGTRLGDYRQV